MSDPVGSIITVTGCIEPNELGITLPHEHLFADWRRYEPPESAYEREIAEAPISLENLWWIRRNPTQHKDNLRLASLEDAVDEVRYFRDAGGTSIVDVTPKHRGSDPVRARAVANETGINVVQGTSFYTAKTHPERIADAGIEDLADEFVTDVTEGIDGTDVRAGLIGEIGVSGRIHNDEEKVLRAGARAACRTGASVSVHPPGRTPYSQKDRTYPPSRWGLEILDIVEEEGLPPDRLVVCHQDRSAWYNDLSYQKELAGRGAYVEYDLFGHTRYYEEYEDILPSDAQRVEYLAELIGAGYESRLLISHDAFLKYHRKKYGGFGYSHILENVISIFRALDVSEDRINEILVKNPRRFLTFQEPST
jgi:phosphotriesterase-related protein